MIDELLIKLFTDTIIQTNPDRYMCFYQRHEVCGICSTIEMSIITGGYKPSSGATLGMRLSGYVSFHRQKQIASIRVENDIITIRHMNWSYDTAAVWVKYNIADPSFDPHELCAHLWILFKDPQAFIRESLNERLA